MYIESIRKFQHICGNPDTCVYAQGFVETQETYEKALSSYLWPTLKLRTSLKWKLRRV